MIETGIHLFYLVYYGIVLYTMFLFYKNGCSCNKMEKFKKTWNYYYIVIYSSAVFLTLSFSSLSLLFKNKMQKGGGTNMRLIILLLILNFPAYINDYAIIDLFNTMTEEKCPCSKKLRKLVYNLTFVRILLSFVIIYITKNKITKVLKIKR